MLFGTTAFVRFVIFHWSWRTTPVPLSLSLSPAKHSFLRFAFFRMPSLTDGAVTLAAHRDVLEVAVEGLSESGRAALLDELERRGKAAVGAAQWPDAAALYQKAVAAAATSPPHQQPLQQQQQRPWKVAVYHTNVSLCLGKMHRWNEAATAAQAAVDADSSYVKAWWRLGQARAALADYGKAVSCLEQAVALEPTNRALLHERDKLVKQQQQQRNKEAPEATNATKTTTTAPAAAIAEKKTRKVASVDEKNSFPETMLIDDETEFTKSDHVKGYKIINGKKTSYFHNELSEDAAKLIGDIAPKKLASAVSASALDNDATTSDPAPPPTQGTSVWNTAGTWEEKDCSGWATESLAALLPKATYTLPDSSPAPGAILTVESATVNGHASAATVRGKKRYIYELDATVHWKFQHHTPLDSQPVVATGTMHFPDIDGTCAVGEAYDVSNFTVTNADDVNVRPLLTQFCHQQGLRVALHESIDAWVRLFKETY